MSLRLATTVSLCAALFFFAVQVQYSKSNYISNADEIVCSSYDFKVGDTLVYHAMSQDSIVVSDRPPITKERSETWRYVVQERASENRWKISVELIGFASVESAGEIKNQTKMSSNWTGRKNWFTIDSRGKRYEYGADDTTIAATTPGGAFQPVLFQELGTGCAELEKSWIVEDAATPLIENSIPTPLLKHRTLARNLELLDTLGHNCVKVQFSTSGQGIVIIRDPNGAPVKMTTVNTNYSRMEISRTMHVPVHSFATAEVKFSIATNNGNSIRGINYIRTHYTLTNIRLDKD